MKWLHSIPAWLRNKYLLTTVGFVLWVLFFDDRDFVTTHFKHKQELTRLQNSKVFYEQQIAITQTELDQLKSNPTILEKYAREKYLMKKDNEDIFVIHEK